MIPHERLCHPVTVQLTQTEYEEISDYAERHHKTMSCLIIDCISAKTKIEFQKRDPTYASRNRIQRRNCNA